MADPSDYAAYGGSATTIVALVIAFADYIKKRNASNLGNKMERAAPSSAVEIEAHLRQLNAKPLVFEHNRDPYSPDLIARVEGYVRAEGDLRIQLARKDWETKELLLQRDAALSANQRLEQQNKALHAELAELRHQLK